MSSKKTALAIVSLGTTLFNTTAAALAVASYPAFFLQPGSRALIGGLTLTFAVYAILATLIAFQTGDRWSEIRTTALLFGIITACMEIAGIATENYTQITSPAVPIGLMLTVFTLWGIAGFRMSRRLTSIRFGLFTAAIAAGVCMLIAVAAGFLIEFSLHPPAPDSVQSWAEYKRSGWTDPRAFAIANTLESAMTHLVVAPFVALVFAGIPISLHRLLENRTLKTAE
jgi:hypothetical protein